MNNRESGLYSIDDNTQIALKDISIDVEVKVMISVCRHCHYRNKNVLLKVSKYIAKDIYNFTRVEVS